jgi:uncharacterized protein (DUF1697 family)
MTAYVAFLKGMNLGRRRLTNDELCRTVVGLGLSSVSAFLASGNVLFESSLAAGGLEEQLSVGLEAGLSYPVVTFVRSAKQVAAVAGQRPFDDAVVAQTAGKLQVAMLKRSPSASKRRAALALASDDDHLAIVGRELYWLPRAGLSDSELDMKALSKALGVMTVRTHRTMSRLAARLPG